MRGVSPETANALRVAPPAAKSDRVAGSHDGEDRWVMPLVFLGSCGATPATRLETAGGARAGTRTSENLVVVLGWSGPLANG